MSTFVKGDVYDSLVKLVKERESFEIEAVFIGTDGSLGYSRNEKYRLKVSYFNEHISIEGKHVSLCLYSSTTALLKNWNIKKIKHGNSTRY